MYVNEKQIEWLLKLGDLNTVSLIIHLCVSTDINYELKVMAFSLLSRTRLRFHLLSALARLNLCLFASSS